MTDIRTWPFSRPAMKALAYTEDLRISRVAYSSRNRISYECWKKDSTNTTMMIEDGLIPENLAPTESDRVKTSFKRSNKLSTLMVSASL